MEVRFPDPSQGTLSRFWRHNQVDTVYMTFGARSVFLQLMRIFLLEMNLLLHYKYTAHCTGPLSNRVGQDLLLPQGHNRSFCWSTLQDDFTPACLDTEMCILQFLHTLFSRRARVPQWGTASPSSLDDLITTWLQQNSYSFFLSRTYLWQARQYFPCRWDRQNKDWEVGFFQQHFPPRLTDQQPTSTTRQPTADSKVPLFASSLGSSTRGLVWRFSVNISLSPKNLLLFWRRCVLPCDLNIPLNIASGQTERLECFCSAIICHCC